jgi:hypothetical protein
MNDQAAEINISASSASNKLSSSVIPVRYDVNTGYYLIGANHTGIKYNEINSPLANKTAISQKPSNMTAPRNKITQQIINANSTSSLATRAYNILIITIENKTEELKSDKSASLRTEVYNTLFNIIDNKTIPVYISPPAEGGFEKTQPDNFEKKQSDNKESKNTDYTLPPLGNVLEARGS